LLGWRSYFFDCLERWTKETTMLPPKLIMVPIDFSEHSHGALDVASEMASRLGAELLLVHVVPVIPDLPDSVSMFKEEEYEESLESAAAKRLSEMAAALGQKNVKAQTEVGLANDVGMELVRIAEQDNADLVIIATHGMTGWREIRFGSVAKKVVEEADCPVLVLRAKAAKDAGAKDKAASSAA
jgi:nucleotide-binding universal stress UspA family protein